MFNFVRTSSSLPRPPVASLPRLVGPGGGRARRWGARALRGASSGPESLRVRAPPERPWNGSWGKEARAGGSPRAPARAHKVRQCTARRRGRGRGVSVADRLPRALARGGGAGRRLGVWPWESGREARRRACVGASAGLEVGRRGRRPGLGGSASPAPLRRGRVTAEAGRRLRGGARGLPGAGRTGGPGRDARMSGAGRQVRGGADRGLRAAGGGAGRKGLPEAARPTARVGRSISSLIRLASGSAGSSSTSQEVLLRALHPSRLPGPPAGRGGSGSGPPRGKGSPEGSRTCLVGRTQGSESNPPSTEDVHKRTEGQGRRTSREAREFGKRVDPSRTGGLRH